MKKLLILNDAPYGSEHTDNGARLVRSENLIASSHRSSLGKLTQSTARAEKALVL